MKIRYFAVVIWVFASGACDDHIPPAVDAAILADARMTAETIDASFVDSGIGVDASSSAPFELAMCSLPRPCTRQMEYISSEDQTHYEPADICVLTALADGQRNFVEAMEDFGDGYDRHYIAVLGPDEFLRQRYDGGDGDGPHGLDSPVHCRLMQPNFFTDCLTTFSITCLRPPAWPVSCSDSATMCP